MTATRSETAGTPRRPPAGLGAADWLSLAAAPTFAFMALLTGVIGGDAAGAMCLPAHHHASILTGMGAMYALMSAFHLAPWLRLVAQRRHFN